MAPVRRQGFLNRWRCDLSERFAHLLVDIRQLDCAITRAHFNQSRFGLPAFPKFSTATPFEFEHCPVLRGHQLSLPQTPRFLQTNRPYLLEPGWFVMSWTASKILIRSALVNSRAILDAGLYAGVMIEIVSDMRGLNGTKVNCSFPAR